MQGFDSSGNRIRKSVHLKMRVFIMCASSADFLHYREDFMLVHLAEKTVPSHSTTSGTTNTGKIKRITACSNNTINTG